MLDYLVDNNGNPRRSLDDALKLAAKTWAVGMETAEPPARQKARNASAKKSTRRRSSRKP